MTFSPIPPTAPSNLGELLKFLRRRARLSQRELSLAVGYSESHISRIENNERPIDRASLLALFVPALEIHKTSRRSSPASWRCVSRPSHCPPAARLRLLRHRPPRRHHGHLRAHLHQPIHLHLLSRPPQHQHGRPPPRRPLLPRP